MEHAVAARGLGAALLYGSVAVALGFVNKAVLSVYGVSESNLLLLLQMCVSAAAVHVAQVCGRTSLPPLSAARARQLAPMVALYVANVAFALAALAKTSVPVYNVMKRTTPAVMLAVNTVLKLRPNPSPRVVACVLAVVGGCVVAGLGDLSFDVTGYAFAITSSTLQASYLLLAEHSGAERGVSSDDMLRYNALLSLPVLAVVVVCTGEASTGAARIWSQAGDTAFLLTFMGCLLGGTLLNYSLFLCTLTNSALTTTIVGILKGVASTVLGFFILGGDVRWSALQVSGILLNTLGGVAYSWVKYHEKAAKPGVKTGAVGRV